MFSHSLIYFIFTDLLCTAIKRKREIYSIITIVKKHILLYEMVYTVPNTTGKKKILSN